MNKMQSIKYGKSIVPQSINGTDTNGSSVDTLGFDYATGVFHLGATTAVFDSLAVQESDDNSSWSADISDFTFTDPSATDDDGFFIANIDLRKRKRYLRWHADPGAAATLFTAFFMLSRAEQAPSSTTGTNTVQIINA